MIAFRYEMKLNFSNPICEHQFMLRIMPGNTIRQNIQNISFSIHPLCAFSKTYDGFGNIVLFGNIREPHNTFTATLEGNAEIENTLAEERISLKDAGMFQSPTILTAPSAVLQKLLDRVEVNHYANDYDQALALSKVVHAYMEYVPGTTDSLTTASEAAAQKKGVCQDYAHILLALCRMKGIACRYVAGIMEGEGETHAWVEVADGEWWRPVDPTNQTSVENYIRFAVGRDAGDCEISKGVFRGSAEQLQTIHAQVESL